MPDAGGDRARFGFDYDPRRNRILVHIRDFWTMETVRAFAAAAGAKAQEVRAIRDDYDVLIRATSRSRRTTSPTSSPASPRPV